MVAIARRDYRDVLLPAEHPGYECLGLAEGVSRRSAREAIKADWRQYQEWLGR